MIQIPPEEFDEHKGEAMPLKELLRPLGRNIEPGKMLICIAQDGGGSKKCYICQTDKDIETMLSGGLFIIGWFVSEGEVVTETVTITLRVSIGVCPQRASNG